MILLASRSNQSHACNVTPVFSNSLAHTCGLPTIVTAINTSTGTFKNNAKYWWKINYVKTGDTIIGRDTAIFYLKKGGVNTVKLFVKDSSGCIDSSGVNITVTTNAKTILDQNYVYTHTPTWMNCLQYITDPDSFRVNFESADTLKNLRIIWGDGSTDYSGNDLPPNTQKSHLYNSLGIFHLKIVTTNGSCTDTVYGIVYNQRQPTAGIIGPPSGSNRGCVPHTLRIINNSYNISNNTTFLIDWGNGETETKPYTAFEDTFFHTYNKGVCMGIIKITATNVCGSSFSTWNPIDISDKDKALWTVTTSCSPTGAFVFQNLSTDNYCLVPDIKEYFWDFGDGTTVGWTGSKASQNHIYSKEGDYTVSLIAKTACGNDTFKSKVRVFHNPVAKMIYDKDRGCKPLSVRVVDTSTGRGLTRQWSVNDGGTVKTFTDSILNYTFTKAGNNSISLSVSNICNSSGISKTFVVTDKPKAQFANIPSNCIPVVASFTNTTVSYFNNPTFQWDFGDGTTSTAKNPSSKTYTTAGTYTVRLIVNDSCGSDTFSQNFTVYQLPLAVLNGDTVACTFDSVRFYNSSINSNSYIWNFGDNQTATTSDTGLIKHVYSVPGTYPVRLISGTGSGCKDTADLSILIRPGAKADFTINKQYACSPATFKFTNTSVYGKDYFWYANGQLISTANAPSDTLINTDTTIVRLKLIATSNSSCQGDSIEKIYFTAKNPKAVIADKDSGCGPLTVNFVNLSTSLYSSFWNLGNGSTSTLKDPTAVYAPALAKDTFYYPKLRVSSWAGCLDSMSAIIKVFPAPSAGFSPDKNIGCGPLLVGFNNLSSTNNNDPFSSLKHLWNFGDGNTDTSAFPSHTYSPDNAKDTIYNFSLKVTSINGCSDSISSNIKVYPKPYVDFTPDKTSGCEILDVAFTNISSPKDTGSIGIMNFSWSSGNGNISNSRDFNSSYMASVYGDTVYTVKLIGTSEHSCIDSISKNITVHPDPVANFGIASIDMCTPVRLKVDNSSVSKDGGALGNIWDFGNGYISNSFEDSTVYFNNSNNDQNHTIVYKAISQYGCRDTASIDITVHPKPISKFGVSGNRLCAPAILQLSDSSINANSYFWSEGLNLKGNGTHETIILPGLKLFDTSYIIAHSVTSVFGCKSDTVYQLIQVLGQPDADFNFAKDSSCAKEIVSIFNTSLGAYQYNWNLGDNTNSNAVNPKHKYKLNSGDGKDTVFQVTLEAIAPAGCRDTVSKPLLLVTPTSEGISLINQLGCTDLHTTLFNKSSAYKTRFWDPGDNSGTLTTDTIHHVYVNNSGTTTFQPKATLYRSKYNCFDTVSAFMFVYPKPEADFRVLRSDPCNDGTHQFVNQSKNSNDITWFVDSNTIYSFNSFTMKLTPAIKKDTFFSVKIISTNAYGCADTLERIIKVKPKLLVDFERTPVTACENATVSFVNKSFNSVRYLWRFGDGGLSNDMNPNYIYTVYGTYNIKLYGYDKDGCVDSSAGNTLYKILERPTADFSYLPAFPKLPNANVDFTAKPTIVTANVDDLSYDWDFGDNSYPTINKNQKNPSHVYTNAGNVAVTLKVANQGCGNQVTKYFNIEDPKPVVGFTPDTMEGCVPLKVKFKNTTTNVQTFRWIFGDGSPDSYDKEPTHIFTIPGTWGVTLVATGTGGTSTMTKDYLITTYPQPVLEFSTTKRFLTLPNAVFNMQNNSNSVYNTWDLIDSTGAVVQTSKLRDPSFLINSLGRYTVRLVGMNSQGCIDTLIKPDYIGTLGQGYVYVPNSFSPNGNSKNDGFMPSLYNVMERNYTFRVFNRWGEMVFETHDINAQWDGKLKGETCEQDVYIWTVNGEYYNNDLFAFRGTVTLLR